MKCGPLVGNHSSGVMFDYTEPAVYRSAASLTCPPGLQISGQEEIFCNEHGMWEPDPSEFNCSSSEDDVSRTGDCLILGLMF